MTTRVRPPAGAPTPPAIGLPPDGAPSAVTTPGAARRPRALTGLGSVVLWLAVRLYPLVLLVIVWHVLGVRGVLGNQFVMPLPGQVLDQAVVLWQDGTLPQAIAVTLRRVLTAYALAIVVGVSLGVAVGRLPWVRMAMRPLMSFFFPTPKVAIYPALLIIFGLGAASKIALGFAEALFPVLLATAAATSQVELRLVWSARSLGVSERGTLWRIVLPSTLPGILTGARISLIGALVGVFLAEMIAGSDGLGQLMVVAYRVLETADMYVAVVTVSLLGFLLDRTFLWTRRRLLVWAPEGEQ